jgi:hypothetical protein
MPETTAFITKPLFILDFSLSRLFHLLYSIPKGIDAAAPATAVKGRYCSCLTWPGKILQIPKTSWPGWITAWPGRTTFVSICWIWTGGNP